MNLRGRTKRTDSPNRSSGSPAPVQRRSEAEVLQLLHLQITDLIRDMERERSRCVRSQADFYDRLPDYIRELKDMRDFFDGIPVNIPISASFREIFPHCGRKPLAAMPDFGYSICPQQRR